MNSSINCGINGQYKVDIYSGKQLVSTTDWFSNSITNTGILYPYYYPFARCFMYLSLGSGTFNNLQNPTGFSDAYGTRPYTSYKTNSNTYQSGQYIGWGAYVTVDNGCGTVFRDYGIDMYRTWKIPSGSDGDTLGDELKIQSLMVSPKDASDPTGRYAFSVVNQAITIPSGYNAAISYKLSLKFNEYINAYNLFTGANDSNGNGYFNTGNAFLPTAIDTGLVSGWTKLSGIYRHLFPGIQFVDNSGACVTTIFGSQMEPSLSYSNGLYFYLSPDISQFSTSKYGTGFIDVINNDKSLSAQESGAYNSCGLAANYWEYQNYINAVDKNQAVYTSIESSLSITNPNTFYYSGDSVPESSFDKSNKNPTNITIYQSKTLKNIHLDNIPSVSGYLTKSNFKYNQKPVYVRDAAINCATPGASKWNNALGNYGQSPVFSTPLVRYPFKAPLNAVDGFEKVTKVGRIFPIQALGYNARYGSMTLAYLGGTKPSDIANVTAYPYMEYLFLDTSGRAANCPHYRLIPDIYFLDRGTGVTNIVFTITGSGVDSSSTSPVQKIINLTGFMGGYYAGNSSGISGGRYQNNLNNNPSGYYCVGNPPDPSLIGDEKSINGGSGNGAVYGFLVTNPNWNNLPYDVCLLDNPVWSGFSGEKGPASAPSASGETGLLYWPTTDSPLYLLCSNVSYSGNWSGASPTGLVFTDSNNTLIGDAGYGFVKDITFRGTGILYNVSGSNNSSGAWTGAGLPSLWMKFLTNGALSGSVTGYGWDNIYHRATGVRVPVTGFSSYVYSGGASLTGFGQFLGLFNTGEMKLQPTSFKKPAARIHHVEYIQDTGYRLLPNYGIANTNFTGASSNVYDPVRGGSFPGLSMENGMELYFDFKWKRNQ